MARSVLVAWNGDRQNQHAAPRVPQRGQITTANEQDLLKLYLDERVSAAASSSSLSKMPGPSSSASAASGSEACGRFLSKLNFEHTTLYLRTPEVCKATHRQQALALQAQQVAQRHSSAYPWLGRQYKNTTKCKTRQSGHRSKARNICDLLGRLYDKAATGRPLQRFESEARSCTTDTVFKNHGIHNHCLVYVEQRLTKHGCLTTRPSKGHICAGSLMHDAGCTFTTS